MNPLQQRIAQKLAQRKAIGTFRQLTIKTHLIDFCSNDYLGLASHTDLGKTAQNPNHSSALGATGSRLISGNNSEVEALENQLAHFFNAPTALLFNSGYTANMAAVATLALQGDCIIYDELIHASLHDGLRLSKAHKTPFAHNNLAHLAQQIAAAKAQISEENCVFILIESLYSMDGDLCPIKEIVALAKQYNAYIILDEAHSTGLFANGKGWAVENEVEHDIFARVHTFGKAIGYHGAAIVGGENLRNYLINFARPFIYTTAMPLHSIATLSHIFYFLQENTALIAQLQNNIAYFRQQIAPIHQLFIPSQTPIQSLILPGNEAVKNLAARLETEAQIYVKAIVAPTVPQGKERLRICLHAFNTFEQIDTLVNQIKK